MLTNKQYNMDLYSQYSWVTQSQSSCSTIEVKFCTHSVFSDIGMCYPVEGSVCICVSVHQCYAVRILLEQS